METKDEQFELCSQNLNKQQVLQHLPSHSGRKTQQRLTHIWVFGLNFQRSICDEHRKWNTLRSVEIWYLDFSNITVPLPH